MTRALVLSGGGPVGIAWETGLAVGLASNGVDLAEADRIVGTSAGSVVGAQLALGWDLKARAEAQRAPAAGGPPSRGAGDPSTMTSRMQRFMEVMAEAGTNAASPEQGRATLGRFALEADAGPEDDFLALFADFAGQEWPKGYACTAVDAETGAFVVWDEASGAPLERAVASSCAVPGIFPPITIDGRRYIDGGMRSGTNTDVVAGAKRVLVVSVMPVDLPPGVGGPFAERLLAQRRSETEAVTSAGGTVETIGPNQEFLAISGWGMFLMDRSRTTAALDAGIRQGESEAARISGFWA